MTKLLRDAIQCLRKFPPDIQNNVARMLISQLQEEPEPGDLEEIKTGKQIARISLAATS